MRYIDSPTLSLEDAFWSDKVMQGLGLRLGGYVIEYVSFCILLYQVVLDYCNLCAFAYKKQ